MEGELITDPRLIKFRPGMRLAHWRKNVVAVGLASGFIEPLESTSIHLIQRNMIRLIQMFPLTDIEQFNRQTRLDIESIRDFIILHYCVTDRNDSPFWRYCRNMEIPESLAHRIRLFRETGRVFREEGELFAENSWIQVMMGQGIVPEQYHPVVDVMGKDELERFLATIKSRVDAAVSKLPEHDAYIDQYCRAAK